MHAKRVRQFVSDLKEGRDRAEAGQGKATMDVD